MADRIGVSVIGHGTVSVVPDRVLVTVSAHAQAADPASANEQASAAMRAMLAVAVEAGVPEADRQTRSGRLSSYRPTTGEPTEHHANQQLLLRLGDVAGAGALVQRVVVAGGRNAGVDTVVPTVDDPAAFLDQARDRALADARHRAEEIARHTGRELGPVVAVVEGDAPPPHPRQGRRGGVNLAFVNDTSMPVEAGELEVEVTVWVDYAWAA